MEYSHIGWTPCINGHLDFALIQPGIVGGLTNNTIDKNTTCINYATKPNQPRHHSRRIIIQSKVDWKDTPNPDYSGIFRVFLICEVLEHNDLDKRTLKGYIHIYRQKGSINDDRIFDITHRAKKEFCKKDYSLESIESLNSDYNSLHSELSDNEKVESIKFKVSCNGLTFLNEPENSKLSLENKYIVTRQAFYYIKYSLHTHKYHNSELDSLTTIIPLSENLSEVGLKLAGQLKRELTSIKRTYSLGDNVYSSDALGIITYFNSLYVTLKNEKFISNEIYIRESLYLSSLKDSFSILEQKVSKKTNNLTKVKDFYLILSTLIATSIALLIVIIDSFVKFSGNDILALPYTKAVFTQILIISISLIALFLLLKYKFSTSNKNIKNNTNLSNWTNNIYKKPDEEFKEKRNLSYLPPLSIVLSFTFFENYLYMIFTILSSILIMEYKEIIEKYKKTKSKGISFDNNFFHYIKKGEFKINRKSVILSIYSILILLLSINHIYLDKNTKNNNDIAKSLFGYFSSEKTYNSSIINGSTLIKSNENTHYH